MAMRLDTVLGAYPGILEQLDATQLRELGDEYIARTRIHRKLERPFFTDKLPNNFEHIGFIHLILAQRQDHRRATASSGVRIRDLQT